MLKTKIILIFISLSITTTIFAQRLSPSFTKHVITDSLRKAKKIFPADIDGDGDFDIAASASNTSSDSANIIWCEDTTGNQEFKLHTISNTFFTARGIYAADYISNGSDYLEIVAGSADKKKITIWEYNTTSEIWVADSSFSTSAPNNYSINAADVDEDGNLDILATFGPSTDGLYWFEGDGDGGFVQHPIAISYTNAVDIHAGYIDNDSDIDILGAGFIGSGNNITNDGEFHCIACTRDSSSGNISLFQDGSNVISNTSTGITGNLVEDGITAIATDYHSSSYYMNGLIGQVWVWDTILTATEILQVYNATKIRYI